jgi:hypothetical protein
MIIKVNFKQFVEAASQIGRQSSRYLNETPFLKIFEINGNIKCTNGSRTSLQIFFNL